MWNTILSAIISITVTAVSTVITAVLIPAAVSWLKARTRNQKLQSVIDDITITVQTSVDMIEQTVVNQLKADGKWNATAQSQVLESAVTEVIDGLTQSTYEMLKSENADVELLVKRYIEAYIQSKKTNK